MKKKTFVCIVVFAVLLLNACSYPSDIEPALDYDDLELAKSETLLHEPLWIEAYREILRYYYEQTAHLTDEGRYEESWMFTLHDINKNDVPELIIWASEFGSFFFSAYSAYTFADGNVGQLEITESFGARPGSLMVSAPSNDILGMIVCGIGEGFRLYHLINMTENRLEIAISLHASAAPLFAGYDNILYYVRGVEFSAMPLPEFLYWLMDDHERMISRSYVLVSESEFYRIHDDVFGAMADGQHPRVITETNIFNIVNLYIAN